MKQYKRVGWAMSRYDTIARSWILDCSDISKRKPPIIKSWLPYRHPVPLYADTDDLKGKKK